MHILNWIGILALGILALSAASHALLRKKDSRAALGWVAVSLTFPLAGPILYLLFGINRVQRRASHLRKLSDTLAGNDSPAPTNPRHAPNPKNFHASFRYLERIGRNVLGVGLSGGNCIEPLMSGDTAYAQMLYAIGEARQSIYLGTYILATDHVGKTFMDALKQAMDRGVDVRVLLDGLGEKYSWPLASWLLKKRKIPTARFIPPRLFPLGLHINLRNHRKILVVDGAVAFTGGMNISQRHSASTASSITDMHFIIRGPIVSQLQEVFLDDWFFTTKERLTAPVGTADPWGDCLCRAVIDGPDHPTELLTEILTGVISAAHTSIKIMTPYFLPPRSLLAALKSARYRDVRVEIILPLKSNLPFVQWATGHILGDLLQTGVIIAFQPPPFCHTKLMLVDDAYVHLGSANLDSRSLRLNFELTLEVLDRHLFTCLVRHFDAVLGASWLMPSWYPKSRRLPVRLRDALLWLFSPYL